MINPKKYDIPFDHLTVGSEVIDFAESAKNLGVHIDEDLSMKCHFSNLSKAIYFEIRRLKTMFGFVNEKFFKNTCYLFYFISHGLL